METVEIIVMGAGAASIVAVLLYFLGPRRGTAARRTAGRQEVEVTSGMGMLRGTIVVEEKASGERA